MPLNAGVEYGLAQDEYTKANSDVEKLKALQKMFASCPKHKGAEGELQEIKTKISKLKAKIEKEREKRAKGFSIAIKREGAAQIVLIGLPNAGKSTLLKRLTNANPKIEAYEFTTKAPEIGAMDYHGIKLQIIEIPAIFEGFMESPKGPSYFSIARNANLLIIVLDGRRDIRKDLKVIESEAAKAFVTLDKEVKCLVYLNKKKRKIYRFYSITDETHVQRDIWKKLNLIYVYTKTPGKEKEYPPVALKKYSTVKDLAEIVHKDFIKKFKFARVWGKSVKHNATNVGLDHKLQEEDIVEFHTR